MNEELDALPPEILLSVAEQMQEHAADTIRAVPELGAAFIAQRNRHMDAFTRAIAQ